MNGLKATRSTTHPRIKLVSKRSIAIEQNTPAVNADQTEESILDIPSNADSSPVSPREITTESSTPTVTKINSPTRETLPTIFDNKISSIEPTNEIPVASSLDQSISTKTIIFRVILIGIVILICTAAAVIPPILLSNLRQNSTKVSNSTTTLSLCSSSTCIGSETPYRISTITALFPFDGNSNDLYGNYIGIDYGSSAPPYDQSTSYIRSSIELRSNKYQYVQISSMDFRQQSFTLQFWYLIYGSGSAVDYGLFSQCDSNLICLSLSVRYGRITLSFDSMNSSAKALVGGTVTTPSYWYHITIVYDAILRQQLIYVNGRIDAVSSGMTNPYQGVTLGANTYIGLSSAVNYLSSYFYGAFDHLTISIGVVRTACQIYNDATLFVYFPFDTIDTLLDRSVNMLHGVASRLTTVPSGRVKQAISFESNTSYFQAPCFPTIRPVNIPFSIVLWIKPSMVVGGGSLVHISSFQNGTGIVCYDFLGFTATGILMAQLMVTATNITGIQGTILPLNTWSHIAVIYSPTNGFNLFINGQLTASAMLSVYNNNDNSYITLGNNSPGLSIPSSTCLSSPIVGGSYQGAIDEFRLYNRELNMNDLCVLINA